MKSLIYIAVLAVSGTAVAQPKQEVVTLEQAVELAMKQQPELRASRAQVEAALGRIDQARVAQRPTVSLSAQAGVGSTQQRACVADPSMTCGGFVDAQATGALGATASWRIWDFGQTRANIRAAELTAEASAANIGTTTIDIRTQVELSYLESVARQRLVAVAEATVKSEEIHLDQAKRFVAAQAKDPIEVAQAQSRAANARSALAQAQSSLAIALATLRASIGWVDPSRSLVPDQTWPTSPVEQPPELAVLVQQSLQHRPELLQLEKQVAAAEANLDAARAERRPTLSATASTQWSPDNTDWSPEPSWVAGLTLSWQLFDGGRSRADQRVARANVTSAQAERDALLISLTSQLELSRAQIDANRVNVQASNEAVTAARAQLKLADARYAQGLGSQIELADAQTAVTTAEGNLVQAEWQLAAAWANLRRATGQQ